MIVYDPRRRRARQARWPVGWRRSRGARRGIYAALGTPARAWKSQQAFLLNTQFDETLQSNGWQEILVGFLRHALRSAERVTEHRIAGACSNRRGLSNLLPGARR